MKRLLLIWTLCMLAAAVAWASDAPVMSAFSKSEMILMPSGEVRTPGTLDDPQPDTIRYDDGGISNFYSSTNQWSRVRFTAPDAFELRSIYFVGNNPNGNTAVCSLYVHASNAGALGAVLSAFALPGSVLHLNNFTNPTWNDVNLPTPVQLTAGQDFFVVIGPAPGGPQSAGWHIILDGTPGSPARSGISTSGHYGTYGNTSNDWLLRVGGQSAPFTDLKAEQCYNNVDGVPKFNFLANEAVTLKGQILNNGNVACTDYTVEWIVRNPAGTQVFINEVVGTELARGATGQFTASATYSPPADGIYTAYCIVHATGDAVISNDTTLLRMFVGNQPRWFRYDDNLDANSSTSFTAGNGWGVAFAPSTYTAAVESLRISCNTTTPATGDVRIYRNDATGTPDELVWDGTPTLANGWNVIPVTPPVNIFEGESFTVAFIYTTVSLGVDTDPPNAGGLSQMGTISWQFEGEWSEDNAGNWCIQAFMDTSSAMPPYAIIETSPDDTLQFGQVDTTGATSRTLDLIIYNRGGSDPLEVSQLAILPITIRSVFTINPTTATIDAGDSAIIQITFNPSAVRTYNGTLSITNNSQNMPNISLIIRSEGVHGVSADDPAGALPTAFALEQNFPNPFNPATEIRFALPTASNVRLSVFNVIGQEIAILADGMHNAGVHSVSFDASQLPAGVYFYRLEAGSFSDIRKMLLLK